MSHSRENFKKSTREMLIDSVGANCVYMFPLCCQPLTALDATTGTVKSLAIAAHIASASPCGPRGQGDHTPEQLRAFENGAALCRTHAGVVDVYWHNYPPEMLRAWQAAAVRARQAGAHGNLSFAQTAEGNVRAVEAAKLFVKLADAAQIDGWIPSVTHFSYSAMQKLIEAWDGNRAATNPLHGGYPELVRIQQLVIDMFRAIRTEVTSDWWWLDHSSQTYFPKKFNAVLPTEQDRLANDQVAQSRKFLLDLWMNASRARDAVRRVSTGYASPMHPILFEAT